MKQGVNKNWALLVLFAAPDKRCGGWDSITHGNCEKVPELAILEASHCCDDEEKSLLRELVKHFANEALVRTAHLGTSGTCSN